MDNRMHRRNCLKTIAKIESLKLRIYLSQRTNKSIVHWKSDVKCAKEL